MLLNAILPPYYPLPGIIPYRHFVPLPPKEEAKKHVILSASEISHDLSEKVYALRKPTLPGVCFALLAKTVKQTALPPSGESTHD